MKEDFWGTNFFRQDRFLGNFPKIQRIVEALLFSDTICQQILLGHENIPSSIATMPPHFLHGRAQLVFWQLFFDHKLFL